MNITKLADEAKSDEVATEIAIKDRRGEAYAGKGGPTVFLIVGEYSKPYRAAERATTDRVVKAARMGLDLSSEDSITFRLERLAGAIVGWKNVETEDGTPVQCTKENVIEVLRAAPWITQQVERALQSHASFFAASSAS